MCCLLELPSVGIWAISTYVVVSLRLKKTTLAQTWLIDEARSIWNVVDGRDLYCWLFPPSMKACLTPHTIFHVLFICHEIQIRFTERNILSSKYAHMRFSRAVPPTKYRQNIYYLNWNSVFAHKTCKSYTKAFCGPRRINTIKFTWPEIHLLSYASMMALKVRREQFDTI